MDKYLNLYLLERDFLVSFKGKHKNNLFNAILFQPYRTHRFHASVSKQPKA